MCQNCSLRNTLKVTKGKGNKDIVNTFWETLTYSQGNLQLIFLKPLRDNRNQEAEMHSKSEHSTTENYNNTNRLYL